MAATQWEGKGEIGAVFARGNTDADTVNLKLDLAATMDRWKHEMGFAALRAKADDERTADRYLATWQSNYALTQQLYWFGRLRYEDDRFSGFQYSASVSTGFGYRFIDTEVTTLSGQAGVGWRRMRTEETRFEPAETLNNAVAIAGLNFARQLNALTKLVDKLAVESGSDNTLVSNFIGLEVKMTTALALAVGLDTRYNSSPPAPMKKTDTLTTVNLVYSF